MKHQFRPGDVFLDSRFNITVGIVESVSEDGEYVHGPHIMHHSGKLSSVHMGGTWEACHLILLQPCVEVEEVVLEAKHIAARLAANEEFSR